MQDYFEKNRYNFSQLIDKIKVLEAVPDVETTDIEIYGGNIISKDILIGILQEFNALDNLVQDECKTKYEESQLDVKDYQFAPAWIKGSDSEVAVGYWGIKVNSSFDKVFVKVDGRWTMK